MAVNLSEDERNVLEKFVELEKADPEGSWNSFFNEIVEAAGDMFRAEATCRELRRRKLLKGEGRGKWATYYPTDKGKEAVA